MSLFASTAEYYRRHRSGVPEDIARLLSDAAPSGSPRRLLDVGTGTGFVIRALLPYFDEAVGVDPDHDLLAVAREEHDGEPVRFLEAFAEDIPLEAEWTAHLVTVCRAFHWFDRPVFLSRIIAHMDPGATLAVFGDQSIWAGGDEWKDRTREVVQDMLGEQRRAGTGTYRRPERGYDEDLRDAGFTGITVQTLPIRRTRTVDSAIGLMHSMSFASPAVLGERIGEFDERLRAELAALVDRDGLLMDHNAFHVCAGVRPV
ncbi:trans-aconitate 2-methyltransferase [Microbacterium sp. CIAB417]|uniref:class I SAM-dependent methyltransferase n=1 Tax=Microbacterium sp. CIAB417 TaxID=2860287 RepID=UPI001FAB3768|nr:class I SAM-dependent methyltransferase [Microbacterium sp. CIAB417]